MRRKRLVVGNWKMHGDARLLTELDAMASAAVSMPDVEVAAALPLPLIAAGRERQGSIQIGAQDIHHLDHGAYTGCVSARMAADAGAGFTIVGHSERRQQFGEGDDLVWKKAAAGREHGLAVILCCGESDEERRSGAAAEAVGRQIGASPFAQAWNRLTIAYEPRWAIGTARTPSMTEIADMHGALRDRLARSFGPDSEMIRLVYGGSVTADNAGAILELSDVDGLLVGGASLSAATFVPIMAAAAGR